MSKYSKIWEETRYIFASPKKLLKYTKYLRICANTQEFAKIRMFFLKKLLNFGEKAEKLLHDRKIILEETKILLKVFRKICENS